MVFGHNTNLKLAGVTYHVQTEDRGEAHALIDTTVYFRGRVLHRRTNNYFDLLPLNEDRQQALKLRTDEQHHTVLEEMQSGVLQLAIPQPTSAMSEAQHTAGLSINHPESETSSTSAEPAPVPALQIPRKLVIELSNPRSWLSGKHAALHLSVNEEDGNPVAGAKIDVHIDGSAEHQIYTAVSDVDGQAVVEFAMPKITGTEAAIAIHAAEEEGRGQLRFALRAKPKVSSV
jgi:hypothetical protein